MAAKRSRHVHARTGLTATRALQSDIIQFSQRCWRVGIQCEVESGVREATALAQSIPIPIVVKYSCSALEYDLQRCDSPVGLWASYLFSRSVSDSAVYKSSKSAFVYCDDNNTQAQRASARSLLEFLTVVPSRTTATPVAFWRDLERKQKARGKSPTEFKKQSKSKIDSPLSNTWKEAKTIKCDRSLRC